MKFKLIRDYDFDEKPLQTVLKNREVDDMEKYLSVNIDDTIHWSNLDNMKKARDIILEHIKNKKNILVKVDSDADGYTSASLLINYLNRITNNDNNISWIIPQGKEHGITSKEVPDDIDLVIVPDAGSNDFKEHKLLKQRGIEVVILDHHDCEKESEFAIVVNSQLSKNYSNKQLSGVGIVFKLCQSMDEVVGVTLSNYYLDLVAVGNIADSQDMRSLETRYYVNKGLKAINNKLLKALYSKQEFSTKGIVNITSTSFYINPLINACIRMGTQEQKEQMMRAFLESDEEIYYKRNDTYENIFENTARVLVNTKSRQAKAVTKGVDAIEERIQEKGLLENKLLIVDTTDSLDKNLTGLVANKLQQKYQRGTLLLRYWEKSKSYTGSLRGYDKGELKDLKKFLQDTKLFEYVEGHANAAGFKIKSTNLMKANTKINALLKDINNESEHLVDFILNADYIEKDFILEIAKHEDLWGHKVNEPLVAITKLKVNADDIQLIGKYKNTLKFSYKGIDYIKFFANKETYEDIIEKGEVLTFNIVGKCKKNEYNGNITPQIAIEDFEVVHAEEMEFVF